MRLNFTIPEIVSRTAQDSLYIEIEKEMFQEEFANLPEDATLYVEEGRKSF